MHIRVIHGDGKETIPNVGSVAFSSSNELLVWRVGQAAPLRFAPPWMLEPADADLRLEEPVATAQKSLFPERVSRVRNPDGTIAHSSDSPAVVKTRQIDLDE